MVKKISALYKEAYAGLPRNAWILALAEFINRFGFMVLVFLNIYLTKRMGFSLLQAGRVLSAYGLGSLAGGYLGGYLCDRIGLRRVQVSSLVMSGLLLIVAGYAEGYWLILALLLVYGMISSAIYPANATALSRFCPGDMLPKGFALGRLAANLGITFGPVIGGFLILLGYRWLFWVDGVTTLGSAVVVILFLKNVPLAAGAAPKPGEAAAPGGPSKPVRDRVPAPRSPWRDPPYLMFMGLFLILMTVFCQLFSTFNLYLNSAYGLSENRIGPLWAVNTVMIVAIEMVLIHNLRRKSEMKIIALGACFIGLGFGLLPLGRTFAFAALTVAVWTMGEILTMPLSGSVVSRRAGPSMGRYMGVLSLVHSLALLIAPLLGNWLYARIGGDMLWPVMGGAGILTAIGFWSLSGKLSSQRS